MAKIKKYYRNLLIALATTILSTLSVPTQSNTQKEIDSNIDDKDDTHMFI